MFFWSIDNDLISAKVSYNTARLRKLDLVEREKVD